MSSNVIACDNLYPVSQTFVGFVTNIFIVAFVLGPGLIALIFKAFKLRVNQGNGLRFGVKVWYGACLSKRPVIHEFITLTINY